MKSAETMPNLSFWVVYVTPKNCDQRYYVGHYYWECRADEVIERAKIADKMAGNKNTYEKVLE